FVAVLGANGCGKSTLAKHFNAILLPESGTVLVEGMDTKDEDKIYDIRQTVGMVFQSPDNQIVATVVEEDVAFALENLGVPPEEMRRRVDEAMKMAGIYEYRERAPHNLSGGQKQRLTIARALLRKPKVLILDEPTSSLTANEVESLFRIMRELKEQGVALVYISHKMDEIKVIADEVTIMRDGHYIGKWDVANMTK
ncbi:ATP-binding cassette domain-containing protein, partial [Soehngenia saccharolytica]